MNVLITGGYGFIGSHVAEKFHEEGNEIFIVDDLSKGSKSNISFKHHQFIMDVRSSELESVFKGNDIDIVIHFAGQTDIDTSFKDPIEDSRTNILGLVNVLYASEKYKIKKFVLASSAAIYGEHEILPISENADKNPISVYGISKYSGEYYVRKWTELFGVNTLCFRISNVYGPRQRFDKTGGVIPIFLSKVRQGEDVVVFGDGEQTRDFIYVSDIAEAIYRACERDVSGVYNLSGMMEFSINDIIGLVEDVANKSVNISKSSERRGDVRRSCLDSTRARNTLDWSPKVRIEDGMRKTYAWIDDDIRNYHYIDLDQPQILEQEHKKSWLGSLVKMVAPSMEIIAGAAAATVIDIYLFRSIQFGFIDVRLLYIAVLSTMYGLGYGLMAIMLSIVSLIGTRIYMGFDIASMISDPELYLAATIYFITGLIIGYSKDKILREKASISDKVKSLEGRLAELNENYRGLMAARKELQNQITNSEDNIGKIFSLIQEFNTLSSDDVFLRSVAVIERLLKTKGVAVFRLNEGSDFARLVSVSEGLLGELNKSIRLSENPEFESAIKNHSIFVNKKLERGHPIMAMPVKDGKNVIGIVAIYDCEFERLTVAYQNFFKVIVFIMSSELSKACEYERLKEKEIYIDGTLILKPSEFRKMYLDRIQNHEKDHYDFDLLKIKQDRPLKSISQVIHSTIRGFDICGLSEGGGLYLVLGNTSSKEADALIARLKALGITAEQANGVI